jgi:hypothetical protein
MYLMTESAWLNEFFLPERLLIKNIPVYLPPVKPFSHYGHEYEIIFYTRCFAAVPVLQTGYGIGASVASECHSASRI